MKAVRETNAGDLVFKTLEPLLLGCDLKDLRQNPGR